MTQLNLPSRQEAWQLLCEYTQQPSLCKHALAVEAAMRGYAAHFNEHEELWGLTGLLHDFDYEQYPDIKEHTVVGGKILADKGYPDVMIQAIHAHNQGNGLNVPRSTLLAKALFAVDELCGFITAVALVRPSKSIHDVKPKSVKKKLKEKSFAAAVSRDDIRTGIQELEVEADVHIQFIIEAMRGIAETLELDGSLA